MEVLARRTERLREPSEDSEQFDGMDCYEIGSTIRLAAICTFVGVSLVGMISLMLSISLSDSGVTFKAEWQLSEYAERFRLDATKTGRFRVYEDLVITFEKRSSPDKPGEPSETAWTCVPPTSMPHKIKDGSVNCDVLQYWAGRRKKWCTTDPSKSAQNARRTMWGDTCDFLKSRKIAMWHGVPTLTVKRPQEFYWDNGGGWAVCYRSRSRPFRIHQDCTFPQWIRTAREKRVEIDARTATDRGKGSTMTYEYWPNIHGSVRVGVQMMWGDFVMLSAVRGADRDEAWIAGCSRADGLCDNSGKESARYSSCTVERRGCELVRWFNEKLVKRLIAHSRRLVRFYGAPWMRVDFYIDPDHPDSQHRKFGPEESDSDGPQTPSEGEADDASWDKGVYFTGCHVDLHIGQLASEGRQSGSIKDVGIPYVDGFLKAMLANNLLSVHNRDKSKYIMKANEYRDDRKRKKRAARRKSAKEMEDDDGDV